jgi:hypothetical protein
MMERMLAVVMSCLLVSSQAISQTVSIPSGASNAQVQSLVSSIPSGGTAQFSLGNYQLSISVPCGVSLAGVYAAWAMNPAYATLISSASPNAAVSFSPCATPASVKYLAFNGQRPTGGGGQALYFSPGTSNMTVTMNYFYGSQTTPDQEQWNAPLVFFDGNNGSAVDANDTFSWNIVGSQGDCSNVMSNYTYKGLGGDGGYCVGLGLHDGFSNLNVNNNVFGWLEQGMKTFEGQGQCVGCNILYNDFHHIHRINYETQANTGSTTMNINYNSVHDQFAPNYGSWGFSSANGCNAGCVTNVDYNVLINNVQANSQGQYVPGAIEVWGTSGDYSGNLVQGYWGNGFDTSATGLFTYNNNSFCMPVGGSTNLPGSGGYFNDETSNHQTSVPTQSGNTFQTSNCPKTSVTPSLSPASGALPGTLVTATFTNTGGGRDANINIWYTTDGSNPVPGQGTAQFIQSGGQVQVPNPGTVKAVGMWGAQNQPTSYPGGYGYLPSPVVSAVYTSSGGPPTPVITPVAPVAPSAVLKDAYLSAPNNLNQLNVGQSLQFTAIGDYVSGPTPQPIPNSQVSWSTSNPLVITVSKTGKVTAVGQGTANVLISIGAMQGSQWTIKVLPAPVKYPITESLTPGTYTLTVGANGGVTLTPQP